MTTLFGLKCVKYYECYTYYKCNSGKICIFDVWDMIILTQTRGWVVFCSSTHGKCHEISRFCPILLAFFSATQCRGRIECAYPRFAIRLIYRQTRFVCTIYSRDMCCLCVFFPKNRQVETPNFTWEVSQIDVSRWKSSRVKLEIFWFRPSKIDFRKKSLQNFEWNREPRFVKFLVGISWFCKREVWKLFSKKISFSFAAMDKCSIFAPQKTHTSQRWKQKNQ